MKQTHNIIRENWREKQACMLVLLVLQTLNLFVFKDFLFFFVYYSSYEFTVLKSNNHNRKTERKQ